jgi:hypothetical protein
MTNEEINFRLNYQIRKDRKYIIHKELYNLTKNFTLKDWQVIHTKKYFEITDPLEREQKKTYLLYCVNYYIKHLQNKNN